MTVDRNGAVGGEMMTLRGYRRRDDWYAMPCQNVPQLCCARIFIREKIRHCCHQFQNQFVVPLNWLMILAIIDELTKDGVQ